jgi:squalene-hopene/tetraprenyl-beta-curcumene cyclase
VTTSDRLHSAYITARDALLAERVPAGHWVGELSTSALSTATAVMALHLVDADAHRGLIDGGIRWLCEHQNPDGGWGDTTKSFSNISTTMLCRATLELISRDAESSERSAAFAKVESYLTEHAGRSPAERAEAIRRRYGKDRTFSVPILMACALAKLVPWNEVPRLPFELACLPQSWYRFARLPVVSYALPALIAIGQCIHANRTSRNPIRNFIRRIAISRSLKVLRRIQPTTGGYLEATPLTSFVVMALMGAQPSGGRQPPVSREIIEESIRFLKNSVRPDGSWPIDTNLATWVTTLSVNALAAAEDLESLDSKDAVLKWLLDQQYKERHPYTGADPGGWAWTELAGGVPDCDDTPGAMLALNALRFAEGPPKEPPWSPVLNGLLWVERLQNRDAGWPTFCRGWGVLPFDRSGADLTAHVVRALEAWSRTWFQLPLVIERENAPSDDEMQLQTGGWWYAWRPIMDGYIGAAVTGIKYLNKQQRPDGSWLPLWFGNQHAPDDINPVYGTSRVLAAYRDLGLQDSPECQRGVAYLLSVQNEDGGWGGAKDCPSSVEETALAVEVLIDLVPPGETASGPQAACGFAEPLQRGIQWLISAVESGRFREPSPIGFYFAKLWYFEKLYPIIFTVAALGRARVRAMMKS